MATPMFVVPVHDLDAAGREVEFPLPAAWLREQLEGCELSPAGPDGTVSARISKSGVDVLVRGKIRVELEIACARCLRPARLAPDIELTLVLEPRLVEVGAVGATRGGGVSPDEHGRHRTASQRPEPGHRSKSAAKAEAPEHEIEGDEAGIDTYDGDEVVLDRFVREAVLLESPIFPLCSEACEGIRPGQADRDPEQVTRGPDPRLAPLIELAKRRTTKE